MLGAPGYAATTDISVKGLIETVRAAIAHKQADKPLAKTLSKYKMTERLEPVAVEELQSEGAGPAAAEELDRLREESQNLSPPDQPLPFAFPAKPSLGEMREIIQAARTYALNYSKSLPNFLCTQTVKRYQDPMHTGVWRLRDTLSLNLSYTDQAEDYKLISVNNHPAKTTYESLGGAVSEGEFGSLMYGIFNPDSHPRITWDHWTKLRGRPAQVYSYVIYMANAGYNITYGSGGERVSAKAGAAGEVYLDPENQVVLRLTRRATDLPSNFPITLATTVLDYDDGEIGGRKYFLPSHATIHMATWALATRNEVDFGGYRKFQGDSTITFGK